IDRDDMVTTVMTAFNATTVHCARCHDHKFDPVSQEDYYGLQAVFAGIDRADRLYDPDPAVHRRRQALAKRMKEIEKAAESMLLEPDAQAAAAAWEKSRGKRTWQALEPTDVRAAKRTKVTRLKDRSVLFGGARPERDTYTVTAATDLTTVTAVRLEVLTADSL